MLSRCGCLRDFPSSILSVEELGLPKQILKLAGLNKGLVLVTGPTGSGKSTTLARLSIISTRTGKTISSRSKTPLNLSTRIKAV